MVWLKFEYKAKMYQRSIWLPIYNWLSIHPPPHPLIYLLLFLQEADYPVHEQIDLYDDVISPSANNGDAPEDRDYLDTLPAPGGTEGGKSAPSNVVYTYTGKRIALYIGNLTWVSVRKQQ